MELQCKCNLDSRESWLAYSQQSRDTLNETTAESLPAKDRSIICNSLSYHKPQPNTFPKKENRNITALMLLQIINNVIGMLNLTLSRLPSPPP